MDGAEETVYHHKRKDKKDRELGRFIRRIGSHQQESALSCRKRSIFLTGGHIRKAEPNDPALRRKEMVDAITF